VKPTITSRGRKEVDVHEGNVLYLQCKAEGVPTPLVIWRKNGKIIQKRTNHTDFIHENATRDDEGVYGCEASNSAGSDSYMVVVKILPIEGPEEDSTKRRLGAGAIAGIVIGVIVLFIICLVLFCCRHRLKAICNKNGGASKDNSNANGMVPEEEKLTGGSRV